MESKNGVSAKKIAELTGVSLSTVSIVLNNKGNDYRISEKTTAKILEVANKLGYQHVKKEKRKKNNFNKSLICAFCPMNFGKGAIEVFNQNAHKFLQDQKLPYEIILFPYEFGNLREKASWISGEFIAGAVLMALGEDDITFIENNSFDIPVVLFNRTAKGYCSVMDDEYGVGNKAMNHFIMRGHRKFGIIAPNYSSRALSLRVVGYHDRFQSQHFKPEKAFILPTFYDDDSDLGGYNAMQQLLASQELPTAIFLPSDNMVSGVVRSITESGYEIPKDFEIISYGNKQINRIVKPNITSFAPSMEEMSYNSIMLLHGAITNGMALNNVKLSFEVKCIFRESSPETEN